MTQKDVATMTAAELEQYIADETRRHKLLVRELNALLRIRRVQEGIGELEGKDE